LPESAEEKDDRSRQDSRGPSLVSNSAPPSVNCFAHITGVKGDREEDAMEGKKDQKYKKGQKGSKERMKEREKRERKMKHKKNRGMR
jgi:hypothetical protein